MSLYAAVCLSAILAVLLVYRYDLYNREPWYMLAVAAAMGFAAMRIVAAVELWALGSVEAGAAQAAIAALLEETARWAIVVVIAFGSRHFDDPMDGIIYGSIVGVGMASEESLDFLGRWAALEPSLLPVELVRLLGHLVMGGISAFGVGMARFGMPRWRRAILLSFSAALALHFSWDLVSLSVEESALSLLLTAAAIAIILVGIGVYGVLVVQASRMSRARFAPQNARSLWGFPFKSR